MGHGARQRVGMVLVGLLAVAALLAYAVPHRDGPLAPFHAMAQDEAAHAGALDPGAAAADCGSDDAPCSQAHPDDDGACCAAVQCLTLPAALPGTVALAVPRRDRSHDPRAVIMPTGIGGIPALRPPSSIV